MSSGLTCSEQIGQLHEAYTEYQNALRNRKHGGQAADRLESTVARILGRSRYEFEAPSGETPRPVDSEATARAAHSYAVQARADLREFAKLLTRKGLISQDEAVAIFAERTEQEIG